MAQNWERGYPELPGQFDDVGPKRRYIPSKSKIRAMARASNEGGRFTCPKCRMSFSVTYSRFGKFGVFEEPTYYCKDCSDVAGFTKVK